MELIKLNGPNSVRTTRHLNIKLIFTKQFIDGGMLMVMYCSTEAIVADILSKPLTGVKVL